MKWNFSFAMDRENISNIRCCSIPEHKSIIENLQDEIEQLKLEIINLTDKLSKNSTNSGKPPSSDGYEKPAPKSRRKKSGKKPGGQVGHQGTRLEPVADPDHIEIYTVDVCSKCGKALSNVEPQAHDCRQEFEIPPVKPEVTEHRGEIKLCPDCGWLNQATFPEHITQDTQYGPRVKATATYFNQAHFIPFDRLKSVFEDCYNLSISPGSFVNFNKYCSRNIENSLATIKQNIICGKVAGFDESGMRVNGKLHWLHVARDEKNTYYEIHERRGQEAIDDIDILPKFKGTAIHDHWKPYYAYDCNHGLCNAHHLRELDFTHTLYNQSWAKKMTTLLLEINEAIEEHKVKGRKKIAPDLIAKYSRKYSRVLREGLQEVQLLPVPKASKRGKRKQHKVKNLWDRLFKYKKDVLGFMNDFDIPFTNNASERDIRMCKIKSKVSGSFRSTSGAATFCKIRSYISTTKKNSVNVLDGLSQAFKGRPFMSPPPNTS